MEDIGAAFARLTYAVARAERISYPLPELNDLLTAATGEEVLRLPSPEIDGACRLNYVTAMVEVAAHRAGVVPPDWALTVEPCHFRYSWILRCACARTCFCLSPPPFCRRNIFIDSTLGDRV